MMVHYDGRDLFLIVDGGVKIAKRGDMAWIPLEPGWTVRDDPYPDAITVEYQGRGRSPWDLRCPRPIKPRTRSSDGRQKPLHPPVRGQQRRACKTVSMHSVAN